LFIQAGKTLKIDRNPRIGLQVRMLSSGQISVAILITRNTGWSRAA
jgi:hypothetical protein